METLIRGDNKPIILEFDEALINVDQVSAILYRDDRIFKKWDESTAVIDGQTISLPLTQEETMAIQCERVQLEIKLLLGSDIEFFDIVPLYVRQRHDDTIFNFVGGAEINEADENYSVQYAA